MNVTGLKVIQSEIQLRVELSHNPQLNADRSVDARKSTKKAKERVRQYKTPKSVANGQYSRESSYCPEFKLVFYPYTPNHVWRRELKTGLEVPILEKIDGEWYPCNGIVIRDNEIQALKAFDGAYGMDIDKAIARKKPQKPVSKGTYNCGGKYVYRCKQTNEVSIKETRKRRKKNRQAAQKQRDLMATIQVANVKRK